MSTPKQTTVWEQMEGRLKTPGPAPREEIPGAVGLTPAEFSAKYGRGPRPEPAFYTLARAAEASAGVESPLTIIPVGEDLAHDIAHGTDAVNHLLAFLDFPAPLRAFVDCLVGAAGERSEWFEAYAVDLGRRARTGRADATDQTMERWVRRQKGKLREWQYDRGFEVVMMEDGDFDREAWKNKPTRWRVPLVRMAKEVTLRARAKPYWPSGPRHQARALREAAREYLRLLPEAPPLRPPLPRTLTDEERLSRHRKTILNLLAKSRDIIERAGGDPQEYLEGLIAEERSVMAVLPFERAEEAAEPETPANGREDIRVLPSDEAATGGEDTYVRPSAEVLDFPGRAREGREVTDVLPSGAGPPAGDAFEADLDLSVQGLPREKCVQEPPGGEDRMCSTLKEEVSLTNRDPRFDERLGTLRRRVGWAQAELMRKYPDPTPAMKQEGCVEIVWNACGAEAQRTEDELNRLMIACARGEASESEVEAAWKAYVRARKRRWVAGSPQPAGRVDFE